MYPCKRRVQKYNVTIDARLEYKEEKRVVVLEMSCPWISNRDLKDKEKVLKYAPLGYELSKQLPGYSVQKTQYCD